MRRFRMSTPNQSHGRFHEFISGVPLVTLSILVLCIAIYVVDNLVDFNEAVSEAALRADLVIYQLELVSGSLY